jgi:hypothetical protein
MWQKTGRDWILVGIHTAAWTHRAPQKKKNWMVANARDVFPGWRGVFSWAHMRKKKAIFTSGPATAMEPTVVPWVFA